MLAAALVTTCNLHLDGTDEKEQKQVMIELKRFQRELESWIKAHREVRHSQIEFDALYAQIIERVPESMLRDIGRAFENGWLETDPRPSRGYFIRERGVLGGKGSVYLLTNVTASGVGIWWELLVQLADYSQLRAAAEPRGMQVRLEHELMDITVWAGSKLLLYVENKTTAQQARSLLSKMRAYGEIGFDVDDPAKGDDPLRKAKYLFGRDSRPAWFGLSALGFRQFFRIEYPGGEEPRFKLIESSEPFTTPLSVTIPTGVPPPSTVADHLAFEVDRLAVTHPFWVAPGTGQTAFNIHTPTDTGSAIALGLYRDGTVWTDNSALGPRSASRLGTELRRLGIDLDPSKQWTFWMRLGSRFTVSEVEAPAIAEALVAALASS